MVESDFESDQGESLSAVDSAIDELGKVKAYVLTPKELVALKIAHYALRSISTEFDNVKYRSKMVDSIEAINE